MNRGKKAAYNSIASLLAECVAIICGFILPRLIIKSFGSTYNGLTQSVAQFLSIVALMRAGVGGATRAALYKSLAQKDEKQISATVRATELFMRKISLIFLVFVLCFSCIYPLVVKNDFDWLFSATLVLIISVSTFVEYYFGITYHILIQADQRQYITSLLSMGTTILNTLFSVVLINRGFGIHVVKGGSALAYCITPVVLNLYARKHYHIDRSVEPDYSSINQRWDAMFHQVAGFIYSNTDIMLLTLFVGLKEVSVYTTYCLVSNGLKKMMQTVTTGVEAAFGDMLARGDKEVLLKNVIIYETLLHGVICVLFGSALVLITPFIQVYTRGIQDVDYTRFAFGYLLIVTETVHLIRQPYHSLVEASGQYKQTKSIAITQATLNLGTSIILIQFLGLTGVIIGTLISDTYRAIAYRAYIMKNMLPEFSYRHYVKRFIATAIPFLILYTFSKIIPFAEATNYLNWIMYAIPTTLVSLVSTIVVSHILYKQEMKFLVSKLVSIFYSIFKRD